MSNVLKMSHQEVIRGLHQKGWSKRRIARELGIHRQTVGFAGTLALPAVLGIGVVYHPNARAGMPGRRVTKFSPSSRAPSAAAGCLTCSPANMSGRVSSSSAWL
jgi:hypothetical protein